MDTTTPSTTTTLLRLLSLFIFLFFVYILFLQIWGATSPEYPPQGRLEHVVKPGPDSEDWVNHRRDHS